MQDELKCLSEKGFVEESYAYVACMAVDRNARCAPSHRKPRDCLERLAHHTMDAFSSVESLTACGLLSPWTMAARVSDQ